MVWKELLRAQSHLYLPDSPVCLIILCGCFGYNDGSSQAWVSRDDSFVSSLMQLSAHTSSVITMFHVIKSETLPLCQKAEQCLSADQLNLLNPYNGGVCAQPTNTNPPAWFILSFPATARFSVRVCVYVCIRSRFAPTLFWLSPRQSSADFGSIINEFHAIQPERLSGGMKTKAHSLFIAH